MANKRVSELQRYVVKLVEKNAEGGRKTTYQYFMNQSEAKAWAKARKGMSDLFRINYDHYGSIK